MTTTAPPASLALQLFDFDPTPADADRFIGTCRGCTKTYSRPRATKLVRCCGGFVPMAKVKGTFSTSHHCNADCEFARGPRCVCGCSGRNHGRGWFIGLEDQAEVAGS